MNVASNKTIRFTKASACGNDFLIVDARHVLVDSDTFVSLSELTRRLCDRHNGVGADGVEWLFPDAEPPTRLANLINADGSEAELSGNGTRCVAAEICSRSEKPEVVIRTGAGLKTCRLISRHDQTFEFETSMGQAVVGEQLTLELGAAVAERVSGTRISTGNPHFVVFVGQFPARLANRRLRAFNRSRNSRREQMWNM